MFYLRQFRCAQLEEFRATKWFTFESQLELLLQVQLNGLMAMPVCAVWQYLPVPAPAPALSDRIEVHWNGGHKNENIATPTSASKFHLVEGQHTHTQTNTLVKLLGQPSGCGVRSACCPVPVPSLRPSRRWQINVQHADMGARVFAATCGCI